MLTVVHFYAQLAAHDLHQEVKQWSSQDNDIVAAAKRTALNTGKLSQMVGNVGGGRYSKRDLVKHDIRDLTLSSE